MTTARVQHHLEYRSDTWDVVLLDLLGITLLAGTAARPGDLFPDQQLWPGRALRYEDFLTIRNLDLSPHAYGDKWTTRSPTLSSLSFGELELVDPKETLAAGAWGGAVGQRTLFPS